jgi:hypothetical protein
MLMEEQNKVTKLTIADLHRRWYILRYKYDIHTLIVTESFQRHKVRSFIVSDLKMDIDNDNWVCCYDKKNVLLNECSLLSLFLQHQLTNIEIDPLIEERLQFGIDGTIIIKIV